MCVLGGVCADMCLGECGHVRVYLCVDAEVGVNLQVIMWLYIFFYIWVIYVRTDS